MKTFRTVDAEFTDEWIVEKSKFITYMAPADSEEEASKFLDRIRKQHWDATHHVPAWIIGLSGNVQKFSDDGEPGGTAGLPVLEALKHAELINTVLVVVRYFGGIKLGTGGLVRAYGQSARQAIEKGPVIEVQSHSVVSMMIDYTHLGRLQSWIAAEQFIDAGTDYTDHVTVKIYCPENRMDLVISSVTDMTSGTAKIHCSETMYLARNLDRAYEFMREVRS